MNYSALEIAKYVISHEHSCNREISNLRLQKLLYFLQAKVLVEKDNPCFSDDMEAWDYGPVVPAVYYYYKIYGSMDIRRNEVFSLKDCSLTEIIDGMLDFCKDFPTYQLVEITHRQKPWKDARSRGAKSIISKSSIKDYFLKK